MRRHVDRDRDRDPDRAAGPDVGPDRDAAPDVGRDQPAVADVTVSEERLVTGTDRQEAGRLSAAKRVETRTHTEHVDRGVEHADVERATVLEGDSGQVETLPDGSLSIPVFEEQIVVEKRLVVRERVIVRKRTVYEEHVVSAELKTEHLDVTSDAQVRVEGA